MASGDRLRQAYGSSGYNGYLKKRIEHIIASLVRGSEPAIALGELYASLGDKDEALRGWSGAVDECNVWLYLKANPAFEGLRYIEHFGTPMIPESELVDRILRLSRDPSTRRTLGQSWSPLELPATPEDVDRAEGALGFKLPPLLRSLYTRVGNGGFGPGYGIIGLEDGYQHDVSDLCLPDLYHLYIEASSGDLTPWPAMMLPLIVMGCGCTDCVDCSTPGYLVSTGTDDGHLIPTGIGFADWMEQWAVTMDKRC